MAELQDHRASTQTPARRSPRLPSRARIITTATLAGLAALAVFTAAWVIGAVVGLALVAALAAAMLVGGAWLWLKIGRGGRAARSTDPAPLP